MYVTVCTPLRASTLLNMAIRTTREDGEEKGRRKEGRRTFSSTVEAADWGRGRFSGCITIGRELIE